MDRIGYGRRFGRSALIGLVALHFALSFLALAGSDSAVARAPVLSRALRFYTERGLAQRWDMFAPPPRIARALAYSVAAPGDARSARAAPLGDRLSPAVDRFFPQQGVGRLVDFIDPRNEDEALVDHPVRQHFFDALTRYLCSRDGLVRPVVVRIELVEGPLQPARTPTNPTRSLPLYERECPPPP